MKLEYWGDVNNAIQNLTGELLYKRMDENGCSPSRIDGSRIDGVGEAGVWLHGCVTCCLEELIFGRMTNRAYM
jgi:hypothetical protein